MIDVAGFLKAIAPVFGERRLKLDAESIAITVFYKNAKGEPEWAQVAFANEDFERFSANRIHLEDKWDDFFEVLMSRGRILGRGASTRDDKEIPAA